MGAALTYLALLGATLAIEVPLAAALAGRGRRSEACMAALALNLVTHPAATALVGLAGAPWLPTEIAIAAAEALGYRALTALGRCRSIAVALATNALSASVGVALAWLWRSDSLG
jgi:hypothetical protein